MPKRTRNNEEKREFPILEGWRPYALVILVGAAIYGQSVFFDFSYCDDHREIVEQHELIESFSRIPSAFTRGFGQFYRPVLRISQIIDAQFSGISPWGYHLSNILYHLAASCLVFFLLVRLKCSRLIALLFSLLFTAHPLSVVAVAWIPGRNDVLVTIFILLAFISLIRISEKGSPFCYIAHFLAFALAMFTKETAAALPLVALYYLVVVESQRLISRRTAILIGGWAAVGILWFLMRSMALADSSSTDTKGWEAFVANLPALPALLGKIIFPWRLSGVATFESLSITAGGVFFLLLSLVVASTRGIDLKRVGFGALWFLLFLLPTFLGRVTTADDHFDYMEHRAYLPMVGMWILVIEVLVRRGVRFEKRPLLIAFALILAVLSVRGFLYAGTFRERILFWETAVQNDPTRSNFYSVLGKLYYDEKDLGAAESVFKRAAELSKRKDPDNYKNLAVIYKESGRTDDAVAMYKKAIELGPDNPDFRHHLGQLYFNAKRLDEAEKELLEAVRIDPARTDSYIFLVAVHAAREEIDKAIETCEKIVLVDPNHFHAHNILGSLCAQKGRMEEALKAWKRITQIKPDHLPAYESLMRYYLEAEKNEDARSWALEIIRRGGSVDSDIRKRLGLP